MFAFYLDANNIYLGQLNFGINNKGFEIEDGNKKKISDSTKKNYNLYFNEENDNFHFLNYDDIKDFQTGYSEKFDRIDSNNFEQVIASINSIFLIWIYILFVNIIKNIVMIILWNLLMK